MIILEMILNVKTAKAVIDFVFLLFGTSTVAVSAYAGEYHQYIERDFVLRSLGQLSITNMRGDVTVQGWALDKIRVKARRKAIADNEEEAKKLFSVVDLRERAVGNDFEISAEYGRGLDIQDRLKERANPKTSMEMVVFAPARLKIKIWTVDGKISLRSWDGPIEARTAAGFINIENIKSGNATLLCQGCSMLVKNVRGSLRSMTGGKGRIELDSVKGDHIYVETGDGDVHANKVEGSQLYVSKNGRISGNMLKDRIEFHTREGAVDLESEGFVSGRTESGDVNVKISSWKFMDKALIESATGNVSLFLPGDFSGDVDFWSVKGKIENSFLVKPVKPLKNAEGQEMIGHDPNHIVGKIGRGGDLLRLYSVNGDVRVFQRTRNRHN